jgi:hypothetical protein
MIIAVILILVSGIFIYISSVTKSELHEKLDGMQMGTANVTQVIDNTMGVVDESYQSLYWISVFLIVGMAISIFVGSYMVTTKPIFFFPYVIAVIIAVVVAVVISIAYWDIVSTPELASVFEDFVGANYIMGLLPVWVSGIGIIGGVIMVSRMGSGTPTYGGLYYG